jgi:uncharacterized tellurite resistance protein B-like protein
MSQPQLTSYTENSAEALLRVITLFVTSDGELADSELETLESLGVLATLGTTREALADVFDAYCDDLIVHAGTAAYVGLADTEWVDAVIAPVTDPERRRYLAATLLHLAQADGHLGDAERSVYRHLLEAWGLDLEELTSTAAG